MTKINCIRAASFLAAATLAFSPTAWSLGLGDVTVESFLNQPLQVKIDLISRESDDLSLVTAKLASASDYELIGADLESVPVPIQFSIEDIEGDAYILGTSKLPVGNPVVRLIVEVNWSSGRLLREYTVFLDPPTFSESAPFPRVDKRKAPPPLVSETATESVESQAPASSKVPAAQPTDSGAKPREPVDGEYGPVSSGETLWEIASNWSSGTGLEINKVMIAIQRENPDAFLKENINWLKRGAILRMPRVDDIKSMSTAAAISEVSVQTAEFRGRGPAGPATSPLTPLQADEPAAAELPADPQEQETIETESAVSAESSAKAPEAEVQDQLELVPPSEESDLDNANGLEESENGSADPSGAVSTLREDLARKEEELITQQQENEYLADRIKELESQLLTAEEGSAEDADLARMEERLREERVAKAAAAASRDNEKPWYSRFSVWLIGLLVLAVGVIGWLVSRHFGGDEIVSDLGSEGEHLRKIRDEAKEVLRVLEDSDEGAAQDDGGETEDEGDETPEKSETEGPGVKRFGATSEDAEVLDEESSDPEIQLDLARAYISMGDKEAARVILEEVGVHGSEEQQQEAQKMLDLLAP
jgi:pilus assembly protein FimV